MREVAGSIWLNAQVWWLLSVVRVGPYKRVPGSQTLKHTLQMLLLMGHQVVRSCLAVIVDIKELATLSFSGRSHSGCSDFPAQEMASDLTLNSTLLAGCLQNG